MASHKWNTLVRPSPTEDGKWVVEIDLIELMNEELKELRDWVSRLTLPSHERKELDNDVSWITGMLGDCNSALADDEDRFYKDRPWLRRPEDSTRDLCAHSRNLVKVATLLSDRYERKNDADPNSLDENDCWLEYIADAAIGIHFLAGLLCDSGAWENPPKEDRFDV